MSVDAKERWARKMFGKAKPAMRSEDRLPPGQHLTGFWEVRGYSNTADPWREDRFA